MYVQVYKRRKSAIAVILKIYANSIAHALLQYSLAKVKFFHDKLWLGKIKCRKKFPDIHRSVGMLSSGNGLSLYE